MYSATMWIQPLLSQHGKWYVVWLCLVSCKNSLVDKTVARVPFECLLPPAGRNNENRCAFFFFSFFFLARQNFICLAGCWSTGQKPKPSFRCLSLQRNTQAGWGRPSRCVNLIAWESRLGIRSQQCLLWGRRCGKRRSPSPPFTPFDADAHRSAGTLLLDRAPVVSHQLSFSTGQEFTGKKKEERKNNNGGSFNVHPRPGVGEWSLKIAFLVDFFCVTLHFFVRYEVSWWAPSLV